MNVEEELPRKWKTNVSSNSLVTKINDIIAFESVTQSNQIKVCQVVSCIPFLCPLLSFPFYPL